MAAPAQPLVIRLRRRWRIAWTVAAFSAAGFTGWATGAMLFRLASWPASASVTAGWTAALVALAVLWLIRPPLTASSVARHLNRILPSVQESADLLIDDPGDLPPLARLQRNRIDTNLSSIDAGSIRVPRRLVSGTLAMFLSAAVLGATVWFWPAAAPGASTGGTGSPATHGRPEPAITGRSLEIRPPGYTALRDTTVSDWDLEIPEGSIVSMTLSVSPAPDMVWMETADGDSLPFSTQDDGRSGAEWNLTVAPDHSALYRVVLGIEGRRIPGDFHRLVVRPDEPPTLTILQPRERITLDATASWVVLLEALAGDDYGLEETRIVMTVASGYGEGVTFRETERPFGTIERRGQHAVRLEESIDLEALGMQPADELYLYVRARDNRHPVPNESRTEIVIITIEDTSTVLFSDARGLAVDRLPDYFRSQRQIIIDTERLLADRDGITPREFKNRSQNVGLDQNLLRLRYSELVGDEYEDMPLGMDAEAAEDFGIELTEPAELLPETPPEQEGEEEEETDPAEAFLHDHDDPENATRLAATVKSVLKASLAQMWEAELRLRTHRPREALPYEYRALELLKQVQQASRSYVLRTGFDPPPIDPATARLTGDLSGLPDRVRRVDQTEPPEDELRLALAIVRRWQIGAEPEPGTGLALEAGGRRLARLTLTDPVGYLEALGAVRELADSIAVGSTCTPCLGIAEEGLLRALPAAPPPAATGPGSLPAAAGEAKAYFERLTDAP